MTVAERSELEWGDYLAIAIYFIAVISVGLWVSIPCNTNLISLHNEKFNGRILAIYKLE